MPTSKTSAIDYGQTELSLQAIFLVTLKNVRDLRRKSIIALAVTSPTHFSGDMIGPAAETIKRATGM
jgi:hypothetical protein